MLPVVPAPSPTDRAPTEAAKAATSPGRRAESEASRAEEEAAKLPPMKGLTLNEVRVMLGVLPVSEATKMAAKQNTRPSIFDVYA
jgi:hypothetical protein